MTIQNSYSLVSRSVDNDLAEALFREKMSLLAYSPLGGGVLTGKYLGGAQPPGSRFTLFDDSGLRFRKPIVPRRSRPTRRSRARRADAGAARAGVRASRWFLGASIIGATSLAQLAEDIAAAQVVLDAPTLAAIAAVQVRYPNPA